MHNTEQQKNGFIQLSKRMCILSFYFIKNNAVLLYRNYPLITYLEVFILISYIIIRLFTPNIVNILKISDYSLAISILTVIITSLASILGILFAVILVAFELMRKSYTVKRIILDKNFIFLGTILLSAIIYSFLTLSSLSNPLSEFNIDLLYISIILFIISLILLFPILVAILSSTKSRKKIQEEIDEISYADIYYLQLSTVDMRTKDFGLIEDNPILSLTNLCNKAVEDDDRLTVRFLLASSKDKLKLLIDDNESEHDNDKIRQIINAFLLMLRSVLESAFSHRQEVIIMVILKYLEDINCYCTEKKIIWNALIELDNTIELAMQQSVKANFFEAVTLGLRGVMNIQEKHFAYSIPKEEEMRWYFYLGANDPKYDTNKFLQWQNDSSVYIGILIRLIDACFEMKNAGLINIAWTTFFDIILEVINTSHLGDMQKKQIVQLTFNLVNKTITSCISENMFDSYYLYNECIKKALEKDKIFSNIPLVSFINTLTVLANSNVIDKLAFDMLGNVGYTCAYCLKDKDIYQHALAFVLKGYEKVSEIIIQKICKDENIDTEIFTAFLIQLGNIKSCMESRGQNEKDICERIDHAVKTVTINKQIYVKENSIYITWDDIDGIMKT